MATGRDSKTSSGTSPGEPAQRILAVVLEALRRSGYDGVYLQEVARTARVSLATVYRLFGTRDELIAAALEQWMATHSYVDLGPPPAGETLRDGLIRLFRRVFEPWERNPTMLAAYHRARIGSAGARLEAQGLAALLPAAGAVLDGADPEYLDDIGRVLTNLSYGLIGRYVDGTVEITDILPTLERAVYRLTANNEPAALAADRNRRTPDDAAAGSPSA